MNKVRLVALGAFIPVLLAGLLACEQPFQAGLGPVVDTRPPSLTLDTPGAGTYIWGNQLFKGSAEDDYILAGVDFMVTNYPDPAVNDYTNWTPVSLAKKVNKGTWTLNLDTTKFPDGDIKIRLRVTDSVKKSATTDEIAFYIKNSPPAISLAAPFIARGRLLTVEEDEKEFEDNIGRVGGAHLNYYYNSTQKIPIDPTTVPGTGYKRHVDKGSFISGSISDDEGIYVGPQTADRFPPQIRIWQVGGEAGGSLPMFDFGVYPTEAQVPWVPFEEGKNMTVVRGNVQFSYDVPPESGRYYGFEIRAQQVNSERKTVVHYPHDYYNDVDNWNDIPGEDPEVRAFKQENRYVLIYLSTPQSVPTVDMYGLEDLTPAKFSSGVYPQMAVDTNMAYPWVDQASVNKNGPFTLRIKASHAEGIRDAEIYWEKDDKSARGIFIWDPANTAPVGDDGKPVADWDVANNVNVAETPYSHWGYRDPRSYEGGFYKTRHFIFTYNDDGTDVIPDTPAYHSSARGMSKIQKYTGSAANWTKENKQASRLTPDDTNWEEITTLDDGLYYIEVFARSDGGTPNDTPLTCEIRLDRGKPELEIIDIDGAYGIDLDHIYTSDETATVVNGVIRPRLNIADADSVNAGLRTGTEAYFAQGSMYGMEQFYVLVSDGADRTAMDKLIADGITRADGRKLDWWPTLPASPTATFAIPTITAVHKHGTVSQSRFMFKTSNTYSTADTPLETGALADGVYWLYVFARDNAFNVGSLEPHKLQVVFASDQPRFDFSVGEFEDTVKNPYTSDVSTSAAPKEGFFELNSSGVQRVRNTMEPSQNIQIRIYDDDSLDLGYGSGTASDSKVTIKFTGFSYVAAGTGINSLADAITLTDAQVKAIFPVQTGNMNLDKTRTGTIRQNVLVGLLKAKAKDDTADSNYKRLFSDDGSIATNTVIDAASASRLPDGMYKIDIGIADYVGDTSSRPRAKLKMDGDADPSLSTAATSFWFVVDRADPAVTNVDPPTNGYVSAAQMSSGITGNVTDRNGPITATAEIRNATGGTNFTLPPPTFTNPSAPVTLNSSATAGVTWKSDFTVPINLGSYSGTFMVILEFKDRFGNTTRLEQRYSVDTVPPVIALKTPMITVDRSLPGNPDFTQALLISNGLAPALTATPIEVATFPPDVALPNLANGVVSFTLSATDDFAVKEARWWLVTATGSFGWDGPPSGTLVKVKNFPNSPFPATEEYLPNKIESGFTTTEIRINTTDLRNAAEVIYPDNTTYYLYGMAQDTANLYSRNGTEAAGSGNDDAKATLLQTIHVYQPSDKPFFGPIRPNENSSVGLPATDKAIRGTIYDDDGFFGTDNSTVLPSTVRVWMSTNTSAGTLGHDPADASNIRAPGANELGYGSPVILPGTPAQYVTRSGKNINLNIPLESLFPAIWDGDGTKHYVLEVTDSNYSKFNTAGTLNQGTSQTTRRYFSFEYDRSPPDFELIYPTQAMINAATPIPFNSQNYDNAIDPPSAANNGFGIKFTISDANLALLNAGTASREAYLEYRFNNETVRRQYPLGVTNTILDTGSGRWHVTDRILASNVAGTNNFAANVGFDALPDGRNTMYLYVKDNSGQESQHSFTFNKDLQPPNVYLNENAVILKDVSSTFNWWPAAGDRDNAWYTQRRALLADKKVPVIMYDPAKLANFTLSGSFEDAVSDINAATFQIRFDNGSWVTVPAAAVTVTGRNASWTVYLTATGLLGGTALAEGFHSISISIADTLGNVIPTTTDVNYAFRIIKTTPTVTITNAAGEVYGDKPGSGNADTILTVNGTAVSSNLAAVKLVIRHVDSMKLAGYTPHSRDLIPPITGDTNTWTFAAGGETGSIMENLAWKAVITKGNLLSGGEFKAGLYEVSAIARDLYGVDSVEALWEFTVDKIKPDFGDFTGYSPATPSDALTPYSDTITTLVGNATTASSIVIRSTEPRLQARIGGTGSNVTAVERQIRKYNYTANSGAGAWEYWSGTAWTATAVWISAGTTVTLDLPETRMDWALKSTFTGVGAVPALEDGFYSYRIRAKDASKIDGGTDAGWLDTDNGNPAQSAFVYFFYATGAPSIDYTDGKNSFSSRVVTNNQITLTGTSTSANQFSKMVVTVDGVNVGTIPAGRLPTAEIDATNPKRTGTWSWSVPLTFKPTLAEDGISTNADGLPDGSYRIRFTITDMAGRVTEGSRVITLDNTPPKAAFITPRLVATGVGSAPAGIGVGETFIGGDHATINGTTDDTGINGSASGVAAVWYHLGYVAAATDNTAASGPAFPALADVLTTVSGLTGTGDLGGAANNAIFDAAVANNQTAWFKYVATDAAHPVPTGFKALTAADILNWELTTNAVSSTMALAGVTTIKSGAGARSYNNSANPAAQRYWLVKQILNSGLPAGLGKDGLFSMPLWIRVADTAGNVSYSCYDIWLYPNGDYPSISISNPSEPQTAQNLPRGGMVNFDGVASDNTSVKNVIYRIKVDNVNRNTPNYDILIGQPPVDYNTTTNSTNIVPVTGATALPASATEFNLQTPPILGVGVEANPFQAVAANTNPTLANKYSTNGWYYANMESAAEADIPWNFIVNANDEVKNLIATKGFRNAAGTGANDMIRVWVEMFVFDEPTPGATTYNKISLGGNNTATPRPITRCFYLKSSSPQIPYKWISGVNTAFGDTAPNVNGLTAPNADYAVYSPGDNVRSKRFAIGARLDGNSTNIGQIAVRLSGETEGLGGGWRTVWQNSDSNSINPTTGVTTVRGDVGGGIQLTRALVGTGTNGVYQFDFTYAFDSVVTTANTNYATVRGGDWSAYGGRFTVEVRVRDTSSPPGEASYIFEVGVDNYAPLADTSPSFTTPKKVAGSNVAFQGRVFDYHGLTSQPQPPFRSVEKVYAWFTKTVNGTSRYVNANTGAADGVNGTTATATAPAGTTLSTTNAYKDRISTVTYDTNGRDVSSIDHNRTTNGGTPTDYRHPALAYDAEGKWIDDGWIKEVSEKTAAVMANRMTWQPSQKWDIRWDFMQDTTKLPDGWMEMNYIVVDSAGNASYYQQTMVVMNHNPVINDVVLYTNNRGTGAVFTTHTGDEAYSAYEVKNEPAGYLNSGFISKNKVIGFGISTANSARNWPLHYSVQHVTRQRIELTTANLVAMANKANGWLNIYTIETVGALAEPGWRTLGMKDLTLQPGNHFMFQPTVAQVYGADGVAGGTGDNADMNFSGSYVYAYTNVGSLPSLRKDLAAEPPAANTLTVGGRNILLDVQPDATFSFNGDAHFDITASNNKIHEFTGSKPDEAGNDPANTAFFLVKVWDTVNGIRPGETGYNESDMLYDAVVVGMNVFLSDTIKPTARLYDLNPYTEIAVVGNNVGGTNQTNTIRNAADPTAVGYNILRGGLYNTGTERAVIKSGYIEPRNNSGALRPYVDGVQTNANGYETGDSNTNTFTDYRDRVSGKVILRGVAHDDQLLDQINISIGGVSKLILERKSDGTMAAPVTTPETQAYAYETLNWRTGHTVEWAYIWDTEKEPASAGGLPATNVAVAVSSRDLNGRDASNNRLTSDTFDLTPNSVPTAASSHNRIAVEIVAYVTGFERELPKFTTKRSRQGWYSFYQGEPNVAIMGYNLGTTASNVAVSFTSTGTGGTAANATVGRGTATAAATNTRDRFFFTVPTAANSSRINVSVGGTASHNHNSSHTDKSWNREYNAYTSGSDLWINKPYAHIWRTTEDRTNEPATILYQSAGSTSPSMSLQYLASTTNNGLAGAVGRLHAGYAIYGNAAFYYGSNAGNNTRQQLGLAAEPYMSTDIDYFNSNGSLDARNNANIVVTYWGDGQGILKLKTTMTSNLNNESTFDNSANNNTPSIAWMLNNAAATDRFQNNRVKKRAANGGTANTESGNAGGAYTTSYDSVYNRLLFVSTTTRQTTEANIRGREIYIDGANGTSNNNESNANAAINGRLTYNIANVNTWGTVGNATSGNTSSTSLRAGRWSAVDYTGGSGANARPVIAYYDETNDTLRLAYANSADPTNGNNWTRRYVFREDGSDGNSAIRRGSGAYVSMAISGANNDVIHLAFFNSARNTLVYAVGSLTGNFTAYTVDNVVNGGAWTDISLDDQGNPWIVYADSNRTGNYDGVRIAYRTRDRDATTGTTNGAFNRALLDPVTGRSIMGWEALTMPANYRINDDRLNIEAWPPNNRSSATTGTRNNSSFGQANSWNAAVGYGSDSFRVGYFYKPSNDVMTSMTNGNW